MKKFFALLIVGVLLVSCLSVSIGAADARWVNTAAVDDQITFSGTSGEYSAMIEGKSGVTKITATATLYYKNFAGNWIEMSTDWSYSENSDILVIEEDFTGVSGREYKVVLDIVVYKGTSGESITQTVTKTCP